MSAPLRGRAVGWYGVPGGRHGTLVHIHVPGVGPLCGARVHPESEFQWCSNTEIDLVECAHCRAILAREGSR